MGMGVLQGLKDVTVYAYSCIINPFLRQLANQESIYAHYLQEPK
jgi:hypothetical protein